MATKVTIVVCTRNRGEELSTLLGSLAGQTRRPDEIVVVDASDPPLVASAWAGVLRNPAFPVRYVHSEPGLTRQRNAGVRESTGDLLFFLDDDLVLEPDFLEIMVGRFERHPEYAAGMGTLAPYTRRWSPGTLVERLFLLQSEYGDGRFNPSGMPRHPYGTGSFREVEVLGGGLTGVRRRVFVEDGFAFDERLVGAGSQDDADFSRRLSRRHRLFFEPRAVVHHERSPRGRASAFDHARTYIRCFRYLYRKNFYPQAPWTLPFHWWAVIGLFVVALTRRAWDRVRGYLAGLRDPLDP